jgi:hypothetical protein
LLDVIASCARAFVVCVRARRVVLACRCANAAPNVVGRRRASSRAAWFDDDSVDYSNPHNIARAFARRRGRRSRCARDAVVLVVVVNVVVVR